MPDQNQDLTSNTLIIRNLSKRYGQNRYIISGMNAEFKPGTATGLMGPNGSGKTTFMRLISAAAYPTEGNIQFGSIDIHKSVYDYLKFVGIVGDTSELPQFLTAEELIEGILRSRNKWSKDGLQKLNKILDDVELDDRRNSLIGTYSSGMMQKTMIAAALASSPQVLLLDEPFRALDEDAVTAVLGLLNTFKQHGGTILISSHQREILLGLCDEFINFPVEN
jgi:ABC-type multidrug transport system ATPase subunit